MVRVAVVAATAVVLAVGAWLLLRDGPDPTGALAVLEDDGRFTTSRRGAEAFVEVSSILQETGTRCIDQGDADSTRCGNVLQASAFAQAAAFRVARCTLPGVHEARRAMAEYVRRLIRAPDEGAEPPALPEC